MRKYWDKFVNWICKVPKDKMLHFLFGVIIAAFFAIVCNMGLCALPVILFGFGKELFDKITTGQTDIWDFLYTLFGGLLIQIFVLLQWAISTTILINHF